MQPQKETASRRDLVSEIMGLFDSTPRKKPTDMEVLVNRCKEQKLPLLSPAHLGMILGPNPTVYKTHEEYTTFLGKEKGVVVKQAKNFGQFRTFVQIAQNMVTKDAKHGIQRLVGVCPEKLSVVFNFSGNGHHRPKPPVMPNTSRNDQFGPEKKIPNKRPHETLDETQFKKPKNSSGKEQVVLKREETHQADLFSRTETAPRKVGTVRDIPSKSAQDDAAKTKMETPLGTQEPVPKPVKYETYTFPGKLRFGQNKYDQVANHKSLQGDQMYPIGRIKTTPYKVGLPPKKTSETLPTGQTTQKPVEDSAWTVSGKVSFGQNKYDQVANHKRLQEDQMYPIGRIKTTPCKVGLPPKKTSETSTTGQTTQKPVEDSAWTVSGKVSFGQNKCDQIGKGEMEKVVKTSDKQQTVQASQKDNTSTAPTTNCSLEEMSCKSALKDNIERTLPTLDEVLLAVKKNQAVKAPEKTGTQTLKTVLNLEKDLSKNKENNPGKTKPNQQDKQQLYQPYDKSGKPKYQKLQLFLSQLRRLPLKSSELRMPSLEEIAATSRFCARHGIPVLSTFQEVCICMGMMPRQLPKDGRIKVFMNEQMGVILKYAESPDMFRSFLSEAMAMKLFAKEEGFQRLVGVFPESMCLVTEDAGQTLEHFLRSKRPLDLTSRFSVAKQVCKAVHLLHGECLVHNNLAPRHICVKDTDDGFKVTLIGLELLYLRYEKLHLPIEWTEHAYQAPEIRRSKKQGPCTAQSDVYSIGRCLSEMFPHTDETRTIREWISQSQSLPSKRQSLRDLLLFVDAGNDDSSN